MIFLPAMRFLIGPFPPGFFAARVFAAVILPPLVFFIFILLFGKGVDRLLDSLSVLLFWMVLEFAFGPQPVFSIVAVMTSFFKKNGIRPAGHGLVRRCCYLAVEMA